MEYSYFVKGCYVVRYNSENKNSDLGLWIRGETVWKSIERDTDPEVFKDWKPATKEEADKAAYSLANDLYVEY